MPSVSPAGSLPIARQRMAGAHAFVAVVYLLLGASFLASTGLLIYEFRETDWWTLLLAHSHLYLFFPTFGVLALMAFYLPSVVFTHLYWNHMPYGKARFLGGFAVALALSLFVTTRMLGPDALPRAVWEIAPGALTADAGEPANCRNSEAGCRRGPVLATLQELRAVSQERVGTSVFARSCVPDRLVEQPQGHDQKRWCAPALSRSNLKTAGECCAIQERFSKAVADLARAPASRSQLATADQIFQTTKIFFVIVLLFVGGMLALWRSRIDGLYGALAPRVERAVMVGGSAMLLWPVMDYAYLDTTNALFGRWYNGVQPRLSLVIAPWTLLLLFYFLKRAKPNVELVGQFAGVAVSALAILLREEIKDIGGRIVGIGMDPPILAVLAVLWITGVVLLFRPKVSGQVAEKTPQ